MDTSLNDEQLEAYRQLLLSGYDEKKVNRELTQSHIDTLIGSYEANRTLRGMTVAAANQYAARCNELASKGQPTDDLLQYIDTCRQLVKAIDRDNVLIRKEIGKVRREPYGKKDRRS